MSYDEERERMIADLEARGVEDERVLEAMRQVPRHLFVEDGLRERAYDDTPLPIGDQQTISQPYMVACMTETVAPRPGERILEIGTGSGYQAAILAELGAHVVTVERLPTLAEGARHILGALGYLDRITIELADGTLGWPAGAPYDAIVVSAAAPGIPRPLLEQLTPDGRLVLPIGDEDLQTLVRLRRGPEGWSEEYFGECRFVKLRGCHGWQDES